MCEPFQVAGLTSMIRATRGRSMDGWMDGWMDGGVLIRYLGQWMTFRRPLGLALRGRLRWGELRLRSGVGATIADAHVDSYFYAWEGLGRLFGGFREVFRGGFGSEIEHFSWFFRKRRFYENLCFS